jgi:predicted KAP-like P-loop ATPase
MTSASQIAGNPRLIKRFLNALSIRMTISKAHGVGVDEAALAKMLLFERCGSADAYSKLSQAVIADAEGKPRFLSEWETKAHAGEEQKLEAPWDEPFFREWVSVAPPLANIDLRGILYVSREHAPLVSAEDRLSSEAAEILTSLLKHPDVAATLKARLQSVPPPERGIMMDRVLAHAQGEQEWGTPDILEACLVLAVVDPPQGKRLATFLRSRLPTQITPSLIPRLKDEPWASELFDYWYSTTSSTYLKRAITTARKPDGDLKV